MNTQTIEININIKRIEDLRIKLNGRAYTLTPVNEVSNEKQADDPTLLNEYAQRLIAQLKQDAIQRISGLRGLSAQEIWTRDMFLFSFYTRGMSFVDMA
jgi:hypothetical protein